MKKKTLFCLALALLMLLGSLLANALSHPMEVLTPLTDGQFLLGMTVHQGRLYLRTSKALHAWTEEGGLITLDENLSEPFLEETPNFANLVSDGQTLYGYHPYQGKLYPLSVDSGVTYGEPQTLDVADFTVDQGLVGVLPNPEQIVFHNGRLYLVFAPSMNSEEGSRLVSFDLSDGTRKDHPVDNLLAIAPYEKGRLLCLAEQQPGILAPAGSAVMDPQTNETALLHTLKEPYEFGSKALLHDPANGLIYYQSGMRLLAVDAQGKEQLVAHLAAGYMNMGAGIHLLSPGLIAYAHNRGISVRQTVPPQLRQNQLALYGTWQDEGHERAALTMSDTTFDFIQASLSGPGLVEKLVTGDSGFDVAFLDAASIDIRALVDKGFAAALDHSPVLTGHINKLSPRLPAMAGQPPRLVPLSASLQPIYANLALFEEAGMDVPRSFEGFLRFITDTAHEGSGYELFEFSPQRRELLHTAVSLWAARAITQNEIPTFSDPDFLRVMELIRQVREGGAYSDINPNQVFFPHGNELHLEYWSYDRAWSNHQEPLFLSFLEGEDPLPLLNVTLAFINPHSAQTGLAIRYLEARVNTLRPVWRYFLYKEMTQPLQDPHYDLLLRRSQSFLDMLKKQVDLAESAEQSELANQLAAYQQNFEEGKEKNRYLISEAIAKELQALLTQAVVVDARFAQVFDAGALQILSRALDGLVSMEEAAKELDGRLQLMVKVGV